MRWMALLPFVGLIANPTGLQVVSGQALLNDSQPNILEIKVVDQSVLEWEDFSIRTNERTSFIQKSSHSTVLNRVTGPNISAIEGTLESNGNIFLINSSGVLIGKGAIINCESLFISAISLSDQAFQEKRARLIHHGKMTTQSGNVHLVGDVIENHGEIWSQSGDIFIEAAEIKNYGMIRASKTEDVGGKISLSALNGTIDLYGKVFANGNKIGGEILVSSDNCTIHPTALLSSEGIESGGTILLRSEKCCFQYGTLLAVGGFIEVSGKVGFDLKGNIQVGSIDRPGRLLLDPADIDLGIGITTPPPFLFPPAHSIFDRPGPFAFLHIPDLVSQLENGVNVTIQTSPGAGGLGRIRVLSPLYWSQGTTLSLIADESIHLLAPVENFGNGSLSLTAAQDILVRSKATTNTGNIQISAANLQIESMGTPVHVKATQGDLNIGLTAGLTIMGGMGPETDASAKLTGRSVSINVGGSVTATGGVSPRNTVEISSLTTLNLQVGSSLNVLSGNGIDALAKIISGQSLVLDVGLAASIASSTNAETLIRSDFGPIQISAGTSAASDLNLTGTSNRNVTIETFGDLSIASTQNLNLNFTQTKSQSGLLSINTVNQTNVSQNSNIFSSNLQMNSGSITFDQSILSAGSGSVNLIATGAISFQNNSEIFIYPNGSIQGMTFSLNQSTIKGGGTQTFQFTGGVSFTNSTLIDYPNGIINGTNLTIDQSDLHFLNLNSSLTGNLILINGSLLHIDNRLTGNTAGISLTMSDLEAGECSLTATGPSILMNSKLSAIGSASLTGTSLNMTSSTIESKHSTLQTSFSGNGTLSNSTLSSFSDGSAAFSMLSLDQSNIRSSSSSQILTLTNTATLMNGSVLAAGRLLTFNGTQLNLSASYISALSTNLVLSNGLGMTMNSEGTAPILFNVNTAMLCTLNLSSIRGGQVTISTPTLQLTDSTIRADQSFQIQSQNFTLTNSTISDPYSIIND